MKNEIVEKGTHLPANAVDLEKELTMDQTITESDFYKVAGGKRVPSARVYQAWANKQNIHTEIVGVERDENYARVIVRGYKGSKRDPVASREAVVTILFKELVYQWVFDKLDKAAKYRDAQKIDVEFDENGNPHLKDAKDMLALARFIYRKKQFADRECTTKAERIVIDKLLGREYRDQEEIDAEAAEITMVRNARKEQKPLPPMQDRTEKEPAKAPPEAPKDPFQKAAAFKKAGDEFDKAHETEPDPEKTAALKDLVGKMDTARASADTVNKLKGMTLGTEFESAFFEYVETLGKKIPDLTEGECKYFIGRVETAMGKE